jgi:predicted Zn-dependent protease
MNVIFSTLLLAVLSGPIQSAPSSTAIDRAFNRLYNYDFAGLYEILDAHVREHPEDPESYSTRALALFFSELHRMKVLETDFFLDDDQVTNKKRLKPDPAVRAQLFQMTAEARKRAAAILASAPTDPNAMFAMSVATGVETDYTVLIEKRYFRGFSLSKESQGYARKLLTLKPPLDDGYLTSGMVEYIVSNMNWFFRLFARFDHIEGSRTKAVENLERVIANGRYFAPLGRILLSIIYLREQKPAQALAILNELERDFPENPLIRFEINKITEKINRAQKKKG